MTCEKKMKRYLELDRNEKRPFSLRFHFLLCRRCRKEMAFLGTMFNQFSGDSPFRVPYDMSEIVMKRILNSTVVFTANDRISNFKWIAVGLVILVSMFLAPYSDSMIWLNNQFGGQFEIPFNIVMGIIITVYASLFVGTHLDSLKRLLKIQN